MTRSETPRFYLDAWIVDVDPIAVAYLQSFQPVLTTDVITERDLTEGESA